MSKCACCGDEWDPEPKDTVYTGWNRTGDPECERCSIHENEDTWQVWCLIDNKHLYTQDGGYNE